MTASRFQLYPILGERQPALIPHQPFPNVVVNGPCEGANKKSNEAARGACLCLLTNPIDKPVSTFLVQFDADSRRGLNLVSTLSEFWTWSQLDLSVSILSLRIRPPLLTSEKYT